MIQTSKRAQTKRIARARSRAVAKPILNQTHPLGNRLTRRTQEAINRKDPRAKRPATQLVKKLVKGELLVFKQNVKTKQTKGAFGKVGSLMG